MTKSQDLFSLRLLDWSLQDANREVSEGLPLLRSIRGSWAIATVRYLTGLDLVDQQELLRKLVLRRHAAAASLAGHRFSQSDEDLVEDWRRTVLENRRAIDEDYQFRAFGNPTASRGIRREIRALLQRLCPGVCGSRSECTSGLLQYTRKNEDWVIVTNFDTGGRLFQLGYEHYIRSRHGVGRNLTDSPISLLGWLGVLNETKWNVVEVDDAGDAARNAVRLCDHFLSSVASMLDGLDSTELA